MDEVIAEWKTKVEQLRGTYNDLSAQHDTLKEEYKAKEEESRFFMNELARYKEQYDERLV